MDAREVAERVAHVSELRYDDEAAHNEEDKLRRDVLREVAENSTDDTSRYLARLALTTGEIDFARWCA